MSDGQEPSKKRRARRPREAPVQFPVEATIWMPGQREPRRVNALWARRDGAGITLGLPEMERPYMARSIRIPDASGAVVELVEMAFQQQPQQQPQQQWSAPPAAPPGPPGAIPGAVLRQDGAMAPPRFRSAVTPTGPISEARDENGIPTVVSAAFGLPLPT